MQNKKEIQNQTSKFSATFIQNTERMEKEGQTKKELMIEINTLTQQIKNKNQELEALNLRTKKN